MLKNIQVTRTNIPNVLVRFWIEYDVKFTCLIGQ